MGGEEVGDEDIPIVPILTDENDDGTKTSDDTEISDESSEHIPKDENDPKEEDDTTVEPVDDEDQPQEEVESVEEEEQLQEGAPLALVPRRRAIQELKSNLDGVHWGDGIVSSVIHEYIVESVIQHYMVISRLIYQHHSMDLVKGSRYSRKWVTMQL